MYVKVILICEVMDSEIRIHTLEILFWKNCQYVNDLNYKWLTFHQIPNWSQNRNPKGIKIENEKEGNQGEEDKMKKEKRERIKNWKLTHLTQQMIRLRKHKQFIFTVFPVTLLLK